MAEPKRKRPKRVDGIGRLTLEQKAERDARATYWMNQRKIERVWAACCKYRATHLQPGEYVIPVTVHISPGEQFARSMIHPRLAKMFGLDDA